MIKTTARAYIVLFSVQGRYSNPFPLGKKIAYCPTGVEENSLRPRADRKKQASDLIAHVSKVVEKNSFFDRTESDSSFPFFCPKGGFL